MTAPDFDELIGDDLAPAERARLERVHELLIAAGPPPELPPHLATAPPEPRAKVIPIPRGRWRTVGFAAAATLLIAFAAGWLIGSRNGADQIQRTVAMNGANGAHASLVVFDADAAGNWPMRMTVTGLPKLPHGGTYTLWLTKNGKLESTCGTFVVEKGTTKVSLNAPYRLKEYSGWVVVRSGTTRPLLRTQTV